MCLMRFGKEYITTKFNYIYLGHHMSIPYIGPKNNQ